MLVEVGKAARCNRSMVGNLALRLGKLLFRRAGVVANNLQIDSQLKNLVNVAVQILGSFIMLKKNPLYSSKDNLTGYVRDWDISKCFFCVFLVCAKG